MILFFDKRLQEKMLDKYKTLCYTIQALDRAHLNIAE